MPTYEFECKCGHLETEYRTVFKRDAPKLCPRCKIFMTRRMFYNTPVHFKGSGFYVNDYKKSN